MYLNIETIEKASTSMNSQLKQLKLDISTIKKNRKKVLLDITLYEDLTERYNTTDEYLTSLEKLCVENQIDMSHLRDLKTKNDASIKDVKFNLRSMQANANELQWDLDLCESLAEQYQGTVRHLSELKLQCESVYSEQVSERVKINPKYKKVMKPLVLS